MDIKIVDGQGKEIVENQVPLKSPPGIEASTSGNILRSEVATLFDFKPSEIANNKKQLDTLIEYAKAKTEDHSPEGLRWAIRQLGLKLGTPPLTERLVNYLHRYAYLYLESRKIEREKEQFLKGENDDN